MKKNLAIIIIGLLLVTVTIFGTIIVTSLPSRSEAAVEKDVYVFNTGSDFLTNLRDGSHYVKAGIVIEVAHKDDLKTLEINNHIIRDRIIEILGNIQEEDTKNENFKESLRILLKNDLQTILKTDKIQGVYFNEFIIQ